MLEIQICSNGGPATDPDVRDLVPGASSVSVVSDFIGTFFNFIDTKPSIVESCMYTVSVYVPVCCALYMCIHTCKVIYIKYVHTYLHT